MSGICKRIDENASQDISDVLIGKEIDRVEMKDGNSKFIIFYFTDGSEFKMRYHWIFEWYFK